MMEKLTHQLSIQEDQSYGKIKSFVSETQLQNHLRKENIMHLQM